MPTNAESDEVHTEQLRERSGLFEADDALISFLYTLMRDHLPTGAVERLVRESLDERGESVQYTNGWLAQYAQDLARRLRG